MTVAEWGVLDKVEGAVVDSRSGTNSNLARFTVTADTVEQLFDRINVVSRAVRNSVTLERIA